MLGFLAIIRVSGWVGAFVFTSLTAEHLVGAERPDELELPCAVLRKELIEVILVAAKALKVCEIS